MRRVIVALLVSATIAASGSVVAQAGATVTSAAWYVQPTPNAPGATINELAAISCASAKSCTAVGYTDSGNSGTAATLAESWNGISWSIEPTPNPSTTQSSYLEGVSCTSTKACTAVGFSGSTSLAETWNGTSWSIEPTASPHGSEQSDLDGVSCTSATACTAVGSYENRAAVVKGLTEVWNGASWSIQPAPNASGATKDVLAAVSCVSTTACTAVGYFESSASVSATLAETWDGTRWSIKSTPDPSGPGSALEGVSCTSDTACTAVGFYESSDDVDLTLAEAWNGTSWSIKPTPNPSGATESLLEAVSCFSAAACTAVGSSGSVTLAEAWDGTSWSIDTTLNPSEAGNRLAGASCNSAAGCTAVGDDVGGADTNTLVETSNVPAWSVQSTPAQSGAKGYAPTGVSCPSVTSCTMVGYFENKSGAYVTLAEGWNGISWTIEPTPNPTGAEASVLEAVSCVAPKTCTAVGYYKNNAGADASLAEAWNGTVWSIETGPTPAGATAFELQGVSCTSATACVAVGYDESAESVAVPLPEAWNGEAWSIQSTPGVTGALDSALDAVSCVSASACTAVGSYRSSSSGHITLAEAWNGEAWSVQSISSPRGQTNSDLLGVSCTSATACTAVGDSYSAGVGPLTLAEAWNGTSWSVQSTPSASGANAINSYLRSVSCTSATACTAVGDSEYQGPSFTALAEVWDGSSWSVQSVPTPTGAQDDYFDGVSCVAATACTGIGNWDSGASALAERYAF
jgi:hypothetical protein